jgi:hypothetical protein
LNSAFEKGGLNGFQANTYLSAYHRKADELKQLRLSLEGTGATSTNTISPQSLEKVRDLKLRMAAIMSQEVKPDGNSVSDDAGE